MPEQFLHGIEVVELDDGPRPIRTVKSSVIGLIGTAPEADAKKFPLDTPILIAGRRTEAAGLGKTGTLPAAIDGIFDQCGAMVAMVRVAEGSAEETKSAVIGGVDNNTGKRTGLQAFLDARNAIKVTPRILAAPGFSHELAVGTEMNSLAQRLKAVAIVDGPNTTDAAAISARENYGSDRVYVVDPWVKVWDVIQKKEIVQPASARVAGLISKMDNARGWWWSPSNQVIDGIVGTARGIDFEISDVNCRANHLNEHEVATIVHESGYRLWGNRSCSKDPKTAFLCVRRSADMIAESILYAHLWAVDRGITKTYLEDVRDGVRAYIRHLKKVGALIGGDCWVDPEINTPDQIAQGIVYWDYDFTPVYPAEHLVFRSHIVDRYLVDLFPLAA
nr:phage tail sheath subtilisin-like domain-containing protein [uncultured Fretibacterium sp.]